MEEALGRYVVINPKICHAVPTFRGTRIMVADVLEQVAEGMDWHAIIESLAGSVTRDGIGEAVRPAREALLNHADDLRMHETAA